MQWEQFLKLLEVDKILNKINLFVLGDTNSALTSICAKEKFLYFIMKLEIDLLIKECQEESNRKIVDAISDINLTYSHLSKLNLLKEGMMSNRVINVGSPEVLDFYENKISQSNILTKMKLKSK